MKISERTETVIFLLIATSLAFGVAWLLLRLSAWMATWLPDWAR